MPTKFSLLKKTSLTLCLCLLILGCGTTEYEEQANQTLNLVAEADEADKLLGFPVEVPEPKDANGTVLTKHTFCACLERITPAITPMLSGGMRWCW